MQRAGRQRCSSSSKEYTIDCSPAGTECPTSDWLASARVIAEIGNECEDIRTLTLRRQFVSAILNSLSSGSDRDFCALLHKQSGSGEADALRAPRSRDQCYSSGKVHV